MTAMPTAAQVRAAKNHTASNTYVSCRQAVTAVTIGSGSHYGWATLYAALPESLLALFARLRDPHETRSVDRRMFLRNEFLEACAVWLEAQERGNGSTDALPEPVGPSWEDIW